MIKKLLVGLAVLSCTISPQSSFAAENGTAAIYHLGSQAAGNETALSQSGNGLAPIGVKQADEEMEQRYAKREDNQISPQSYVSEYQIYSEIERRVKDAMLSGQTTVDISDMNIYETKCVFPYYYGYSPYFPEGSFVALYYAEDGLYVEADIQNPLSIEETKAYFAQVDAKLAFYQSLVNDSMTQEQKALTIHDYIVSHSEYDTSYSIYACEGIFMRGIGVCQSYACTYMYILNSLGIDCYFVPSDEMRHGWNIVRINGQLYHVDCTYDDPVSDRFGMASHEYFLLSDNAISQMDHYSWNAQGMTCISNAYESAFWRNSESPIVLAGGNSYYMDSDWTTLIERNNSTGAETILTNTSTNDTGAYSGQQDTGLFYYDGGICDPIPIKKAITDGNEKHLIILTQPKGYKKYLSKKNVLVSKLLCNKYPNLKNSFLTRHDHYNETIKFCEDLENQGKAIILRPEYPLESFEKDVNKLKSNYEHGYELATKHLTKINSLFN